MPFKSRKQFFYLMRNEPKIWREWLENYGTRGLGVGSKAKWMKVDPSTYFANTFKSRNHFFWLRQNQPKKWVEILKEEGIPSRLGLGSADKWLSRGFDAEVFEAYKPPQSAVNNAKRGLKLREKWGRGGLSPSEARKQGIDSGVTRAKKIASGSVSRHDVRRMSAFNRHRKNYAPSKKKPDGGPTAGTIAWLLWGGTSGVDWAKRLSATMNAESFENETANIIIDKLKIVDDETLVEVGNYFGISNNDMEELYDEILEAIKNSPSSYLTQLQVILENESFEAENKCDCHRCERGMNGEYNQWTCVYTGRHFKLIELEGDEDGFSWMEIMNAESFEADGEGPVGTNVTWRQISQKWMDMGEDLFPKLRSMDGNLRYDQGEVRNNMQKAYDLERYIFDKADADELPHVFDAESDAAKLRKYEKTYGKEGAKVRLRLLKSIKKRNTHGTKSGQWSARKSQLLTKEYEAAMKKKGKKPYKSSKRTSAQKSLKKWGDQKWRTKSGKKSSVTGERYLPSKAIDALSDKEYARTTAAKRKAKRQGKQFSKQPKDIAKKVAKYRAEGGSNEIEALRDGIKIFKRDIQKSDEKSEKLFLNGMIASFEASIMGIQKVGVDKAIEEITDRLKPQAYNNVMTLWNAGIENDTTHYNMGKVAGYNEVIDYLSPYTSVFIDEWESEYKVGTQGPCWDGYTYKGPKPYAKGSCVKNAEDVSFTKKEKRVNITYPLVIGFIGGTMATVVGNVFSALYLKHKHGMWGE